MNGKEDLVVVRAAGCVLWRRAGGVGGVGGAGGGGIEVALVHRPKRADWSWPKGKLKRGEGAEAAAVREVREETGMDCRLGRELSRCRYEDARGRAKEVRYWAAEATAGHFEPNSEVDEVAWLPPAVATARLTYVRDRLLVPELLATLHLGQVGAGPSGGRSADPG